MLSMMLKPRLRALWPAVVIACASPPAPTENTQPPGGSGGSSSGGGDAGGTLGGAAAPATRGGDDSVAGSGGVAGIAAAGAAAGAVPALAGGGAGGGASGGGGSASGSGGSAGLGGAAGSSSGACAGIFCEDFEQGEAQLDPAKWDTQVGGSGVATVQQQTVAHGKYALHVHSSGAVGNFATILTKGVPAALQGAGPVFGRVYLYTATSIGGTHIQLGFAGTTRDPNVLPVISSSTTVTTTSPMKAINFNYVEFAYFANSWQLGFDLFNPAPSVAQGFVEEASYPPARDKYPVAKWSCIEWQFGDDPDAMLLWVDGKQLAQLDAQHIDFSTAPKMAGSVLNGQKSGIIGGFSFYGFGIHNWGASTAVDVYYDDLVLDTQRVNCLL